MKTMRLFGVWGLIACATILFGSLAACDKNTGVGANESLCDDNQDNDGDGLTDCADPDCTDDVACQNQTEVECADATDNDGDNLTDCDDPDCFDDPDCAGEREQNCTDDIDNDSDGAIDCLDSDCADDPACDGTETICDDQQDNDSDGATDCDDIDCYNAPNCAELRVTCSDVLECVYGCGAASNYNCIRDCGADGCDTARTLIEDVVSCVAQSCLTECQTDLQDQGCQDCIAQDCDAELAACLADTCPMPTTETVCDDQLDNDGDGDIDCDDADCTSHPSCITGELTCSGILSCAETCGSDYQCMQACQEAGCQSAQELVDELLQACGQDCTVCFQGGFGSTECQSCLQTNCPTEWAACQADDCPTPTTETICNDQTDNDQDGDTDCDDTDCAAYPACVTTELSCSEILTCAETCGTDYQCFQDCQAAGCQSAQDTVSALLQACGQTCGMTCYTSGVGSAACQTCMQTGCPTEWAACQADVCAATVTETICDDNNDNDGDTLTDCDDPDCAGAANCLTSGDTCSEVMTCVDGCTTNQCVTACVTAGCATGQTLYEALRTNCFGPGDPCPRNGGDCADLSSQICIDCMTASCSTDYTACVNDTCQ